MREAPNPPLGRWRGGHLASSLSGILFLLVKYKYILRNCLVIENFYTFFYIVIILFVILPNFRADTFFYPFPTPRRSS